MLPAWSPVIALLSAVCVCVGADYRLEIRVFSYNNPTHRCAFCGSLCCDGGSTESCSGPELCDNRFIFCLRPLGTSRLNIDTEFCPLGRLSTRRGLQDQDSFTFDEGEQILNGLPNPLVFTGSTWLGGAQLFAVVRDADGDTLQLVDGFIIDQMVEVGGNFSTPTNHSGEFNLGYFVLSFRVTCTENFFGSDCATLCVERDDELGHYTCDSEGNIVCREGFQNLSTNCTQCREGYAGDNCTIDLDPCGHTTPCENGATCNNAGPDQYECLCAAGFEGGSCERETNECDLNPCGNGGTCVDMAADHSCSCVNGFTGRDCEVTINTCQGVLCSGNGECMEAGAGSFTCVCALGYTGDLCGTRLPSTTPPLGLPFTTTPSGITPLSGNPTGTPEALPVPLFGGVAGGLLLLVVVVATVVCLCVRQRNKTSAVSKGHTPPQEDIDLKPNPVYGISTSHTSPQEDIDLKPNPVYGISTGHTSTHKDIELKPNPGYGMRVPHESHIHTWDDTHNSSGTTTDIYDYVMK